MLAEYEPIVLGELNLTPQEFGALTISQIDAMIAGYQRRRYYMEDLLVVYSALPTYQSLLGKKAPTYEQLTRHRNGGSNQSEMDFWRDYLDKEKDGKNHAEKRGTEAGV